MLEFVRDRICQDPDFGEAIADRTRGDVVPGTAVEVIWTFDPTHRYVRVISPFVEPKGDRS